MNIAIIGAGPIGGYTAYLLARAGHKVSVYENHFQIGSPVQCTGLLTSGFDQFNLPLDSFLVNTFHQIEVFPPHGKSMKFKQKEYLVSREKFDQFLVNLAVENGAKIFLGHLFLRKEGRNLIIKDLEQGKEKIISPYLIIAADGPMSPVAKAFGLDLSSREYYYGLQATVKGKFNPDCYQTYFGTKVCPDFFAWVVPESDSTARVGLAQCSNPQEHFQLFLKEHNFKPIKIQAGPIPIYHPQQKLYRDNCYLVGDAAGFVKATTLGGLVPGLKQAEILVDCILHQKNYEKELKKLSRQLKLHLLVRKILDKFNDEDWNRLIFYMGQPRIQKVLERNTRENPWPLIIQILWREPKFLLFMKRLF